MRFAALSLITVVALVGGQLFAGTPAKKLTGLAKLGIVPTPGGTTNTAGAAFYTASSVVRASTLTISSTISGNSALTKTGTGTVTLTGANTYTGTTTINGGTLRLTNTGITTISNVGATLELFSNVTTGATFTGTRTGTGSVLTLAGSFGDLSIGQLVTAGTVSTGVSITSLINISALTLSVANVITLQGTNLGATLSVAP